METLKCYVCKKTQPIAEFQSFKSCQSCRKKKASKKESIPESVPETVPSNVPLTVPVKESIPIELLDTVFDSLQNSLQNSLHELKPLSQWCLLSGRWIRKGEEQKLHASLLKKVNRQFLRRCAFPIHKYLTQNLMMEIRDI